MAVGQAPRHYGLLESRLWPWPNLAFLGLNDCPNAARSSPWTEPICHGLTAEVGKVGAGHAEKALCIDLHLGTWFFL